MRCLTLSAIPPQHLRCAVGVGLLAVEVELIVHSYCKYYV